MAAHTSNHYSPVALTYAQSLLELANEQQQAEAMARELSDLQEIIAANPTFAAFLAEPGISQEERETTLKRVFEGKISPLLMNFLGVLNSKRRLGLLTQIIDAYDHLLDEQLGKVEVDVTVAQRLGPQELELVRLKVGAALGKDAVVHQYVDESIIGGLVLRVQDQLIDASVKSQLEAMRRQLLTGRAQ